ncbi:MAG: Gx transporter family protein [Candidatus Electryonea clarkiae]|nr:Gx transporter family protein [Candidatus Electryonea clarkiae]MDP8286412.1 Gx transporter family protein [Candidatus Electryonea clarkiae]
MDNRIKKAQIISRIAIWTSVGIVLAGIERFIPTPLPWIKLGLANGAALIVLYSHGLVPALIVNLLRVTAIGLIFGTWSNPAFLLSFSGAAVAVLVMGSTKFIFGKWVGPIGVSAIGAWTHMFFQFLLASILIVRHQSLMFLAGPSLIAAILSGLIIGWIANEILDRLPEKILLR